MLPDKELGQLGGKDVIGLVDALGKDRVTPFQIPKLTDIEKALDAAGVAKLVAETRSQKPDPGLWTAMFVHSWYTSTLGDTCQQDREIRGFVGSPHNKYVEDFAHLDEDRIALAADRVCHEHGEKAIAAM